MANHCVVWCVITKWNLSDREFCIMLYVLNIWKVSLFLGSNLVKHSNCITRRDIISIWLHKHTRLFMLDWILRLASLILVKHLQFFPIMTEPRGIRALALWPRWPAPSVRELYWGALKWYNKNPEGRQTLQVASKGEAWSGFRRRESGSHSKFDFCLLLLAVEHKCVYLSSCISSGAACLPACLAGLNSGLTLLNWACWMLDGGILSLFVFVGGFSPFSPLFDQPKIRTRSEWNFLGPKCVHGALKSPFK